MRSVLAVVALLFVAAPCFATVALYVDAVPSNATLNPGDSAAFDFYASNYSGDEPADATLTLSVPQSFVVTGLTNRSWSCSNPAPDITCTRHFLPHEDAPPVHLTVLTPSSPDGGRFKIHARIDSVPQTAIFNPTADVYIDIYRTFTVTNDGDDGAGSLRDVIQQANARCDGSVSCRVVFAAPMTIQPRTPLPPVSGCSLTLDAGFSYAKPYAPRSVTITGAKVSGGNGLEVRTTCSVAILGMAIDGFPENGLVIASDDWVRVRGSSMLNNGLRGVSIESPKAQTELSYDVIGGNRRSGIVVWSGLITISNSNRIGVGANFETIGNGASGVFVASGRLVSQSDVIATNREFGVAVGAGAVAGVDSTVVVNGGPQIDYGLDGPTPVDPKGVMPPVPVLHTATYDPATDLTTITLDVPRSGMRSGEFYFVAFYSNQPDAYGVTSLQAGVSVPVDPAQPVAPAVIRGDLRGQTIYAVVHHRQFPDWPYFDTSEYSAPLIP